MADDGGYAFPLPTGPLDELGRHTNSAEYGMSLRDWFAGQALASFAPGDSPQARAEFAYAIADAMLEARKAKQ